MARAIAGYRRGHQADQRSDGTSAALLPHLRIPPQPSMRDVEYATEQK
eukprot:CAMPEP_0176196444 /NCGR_PEP_ID=MMETSP0121_2-20121125/7030_1 /TAXON_ID=160619 /ORGANISM="Kryptoperidinium foliaceum, Strain CCMP 1326" /LENGTH=47 /DNA_ID= /DNA_START= /DNA_END= /DNA_ORIENTATION=